MVERGWAVAYDSPESLARALGAADFPINRLALVSETKPDGTVKRRIVGDLRRSQANALVRQGERIVLPRLQDAVTDAFHQVPISPEEYPFTVA
eukprot:299284-Alexandrium_andersonii.AAC.1